ncbi:hypothetical protein V8B55DRAFT_1410162 [Mucor lusitanicus]|uniref:Uncharacterized protein n=1 Tax=Mucor circinelloides f. lusitanicus TaxID=29924 RepID=A0A8H4BHQ3_MUCCL|nr:hypothetical protein FB192DRAFT_1342934 [Mucor lusitanicus]
MGSDPRCFDNNLHKEFKAEYPQLLLTGRPRALDTRMILVLVSILPLSPYLILFFGCYIGLIRLIVSCVAELFLLFISQSFSTPIKGSHIDLTTDQNSANTSISVSAP